MPLDDEPAEGPVTPVAQVEPAPPVAHAEPAPPVTQVPQAEPFVRPDEAVLSIEARACTAAQLRRFIKSRPYVPMHELRRRFELNGSSDDVTAIETPSGRVYVGLPPRESSFIADLVAQGDVGLELCRDPFVPMVMGVFAMRPISRQ